MKKIYFIAFMLALSNFSTQCFAADLGLREFAIGMLKRDAEINAAKYNEYYSKGDMINFFTEIKNVPANVQLEFNGNYLDTIEVTFYHKDFKTIYKSLKEKYGDPTTTKVEQKQNLYGAKLVFKNSIWNHKQGVIYLVENIDDLEKSKVWFCSQDYLDRTKKSNEIKDSRPGF
jgi:hypothetical protein